MLKKILITILMFFVLMALFAVMIQDEPSKIDQLPQENIQSTSQENTKDVVPKRNRIITNVDEVLGDFIDNTLNAKRKYKDTDVFLKNAEIQIIESTNGNDAKIYLYSNIAEMAKGPKPTADIDSTSVDKLLNARQYDTVDLLCKNVRGNVLGIDFENCSIEKLTKRHIGE